MKIAKVECVYGYASDGLTLPGAIGKVSSVTMECGSEVQSIGSTLTLVVAGEEISLRAGCLPRIDVGEEVMVHKNGDVVVAIQVIKDGESVFRFLVPGFGRYRPYQFVD